MYDVIVIGAGAAGLVCAATAAQNGRKTLLLEKMPRPARKILVTGKGRCNVTNDCPPEDLIKAVRTNPRFMYSAFNNFNAYDTMEMFEKLGVALKTERGNRVFPVSDKAMDIADALVRHAKNSGAKTDTQTVNNLWIENGKLMGVVCGNSRFSSQSVVIATGGVSYPGTGSTGDGYKLAQQAGHSIAALRPSLIPIEIQEKFCAELMGLSLKNVVLTVKHKDSAKLVFSEQGEMLFTHFGVSGPLVLSASAHMIKPVNEYTMAIDLKPALDIQKLDARILRDFSQNLNRDFANSLSALLPQKLIPVFVGLSGIAPDTKTHSITREQRFKIIALLKELPLTPKALRPIEEAVITSGGVEVSQINPKTMQSKLLEGLYFAGEVIDVDAYTGGYNLQIAFSTGYTAGVNC